MKAVAAAAAATDLHFFSINSTVSPHLYRPINKTPQSFHVQELVPSVIPTLIHLLHNPLQLQRRHCSSGGFLQICNISHLVQQQPHALLQLLARLLVRVEIKMDAAAHDLVHRLQSGCTTRYSREKYSNQRHCNIRDHRAHDTIPRQYIYPGII